MIDIIHKLDLSEYIEKFNSYLARQKPLFLEGDSNLHFRYIQKIAKQEFNPPPNLPNLDSQLSYIKKQGVLKIYEIYSFVKIIQYFIYIKKICFDDEIFSWLQKIVIPEEIYDIALYFDERGELLESIDDRFIAINQGIKNTKEQTKSKIRELLRNSKLSSYLVDTQIHYIDESETILVRGGFNQVLKGSVAGRSSSGFFYVIPDAINEIKKKEAGYLSKKLEIIYEYEKRISSTFYKYWKFLEFINKEFDRFDHYQARILFAKSGDFEFIKPTKSNKIKLEHFAHPALRDPKPISIDFSKKVLMITGVNAGGKTMLLKSILASVFMAKYLLPMKINSLKSEIAHFKEINAIIDDPQSVKNDISTFAGRMQEFSKLFSKNHFIVGVDEIELGTDSDEAASLFKVILQRVIKKDAKVIITTHHKRLASMMAIDDEVELLAAIYDEERERPTFNFLQGTIGKSYAFETAKRYGIPPDVIREAKEVYGEDKEKLNDLIQKNIDLELDLNKRLKRLKEDELEIDRLKKSLKEQKYTQDEELKKLKHDLEKSYQEAIDQAKEAIKKSDISSIHRDLNRANKKLKEARETKSIKVKPENLKVGDFVKYQNQRGEILSIKKDEAIIESKTMKLRVPLTSLKKSTTPPKQSARSTIKVQKPSSASVQLDLHGLRSDEAIERLDSYLSDVLITGYDEVLIYHGVGTGKLAFAVKEFLKTHPKVKSFSDAPANMGGMGATLVKL